MFIPLKVYDKAENVNNKKSDVELVYNTNDAELYIISDINEVKNDISIPTLILGHGDDGPRVYYMNDDDFERAVLRIFMKRKSCIELQNSVNTLSRKMMMTEQNEINSFLDEDLTKVEAKTYHLYHSVDKLDGIHKEVDEIFQVNFGLTPDTTSQNIFYLIDIEEGYKLVKTKRVLVVVADDIDEGDYYTRLDKLQSDNDNIVLIDSKNKNKQGLILACTQMLLQSEILQSTSPEETSTLLETVSKSLSNLNLNPSNLLSK